MEIFIVIIVFAILIQFLVDQIKQILGTKIMQHIQPVLIAVILGILFAFMFDLDFFKILKMQSKIPIINYILTGLILSSGAPAIHELLAKLRESRDSIGGK